MRFNFLPALLLCCAAWQPAQALVLGTPENDFLFFDGTLQSLDTVLTNAYSGRTFRAQGSYFVNREIYDGLGGIDTLLGTNYGEFLVLRNSANQQTLFDVRTVSLGQGNDVVNLSDKSFVLGDMTVDGGIGNDTIWTNAGNDRVNGGDGDDSISTGDGNDTISAGAGNNFGAGGNGNDTFLTGNSAAYSSTYCGGECGETAARDIDELVLGMAWTAADLTITRTGAFSFDVRHASGTQFLINGIEQIRFGNGGPVLALAALEPAAEVAEPSSLALLGLGLVGLAGLRTRRRSA